MSPVFGHGRLRLYLLKLLDEAPRHGYDVIRLLQDRFMGVYAPSPGTIYPRLARLEEEGLLTHDERDGRKIYRITDKGRAEINRRIDELDELEREITESVSGIAREVKEDVRETVRSLREDLTWATREVHRETKQREPKLSPQEQAQMAREDARERARRLREELRRDRGETQATTSGPLPPQHPQEAAPEATDRPDQEFDDARSGRRDRPGWDFAAWADWPGRRRSQAGPQREFESLARDFAYELRERLRHAGSLGEGALDELRGILDDALERIRHDVLGPIKPQRDETDADQQAEPANGRPTPPGRTVPGPTVPGPAGEGSPAGPGSRADRGPADPGETDRGDGGPPGATG
jgi:DNA-binding PadR family transcriptional regulator